MVSLVPDGFSFRNLPRGLVSLGRRMLNLGLSPGIGDTTNGMGRGLIATSGLLETASLHELEEPGGLKADVVTPNGERPKVAISGDHWQAVARCLIHAPALVITVGVLSLTFRGVFWEVPGVNSNIYINALQFAAKVHESFILLSLCDIVLHHVRGSLFGPDGVPLGLLSLGFQLNSLAYFFSREFWGALGTNRQRKTHQPLLILGVAIAFLLANLAGPSSAITMIPKLDWWRLDELWPGNRIQFSAYIEAPNSTIFPQLLTKDIVPSHCFEEESERLGKRDCPSAGLSDILTRAPVFGSLKSTWDATSGLTMNITMPAANNSVSRFLTGQLSIVFRGNNSLYVASSVPDFAASSLYRWYTLVSSYRAPLGEEDSGPIISLSTRPLFKATLRSGSEKLPLYKPLVQVECQSSNFGDERVIFPHDLFSIPPWDSDPFLSADWSISTPPMPDFVSSNASPGKVGFTWVDPDISGGPRPSILGLFTMPSLESSSGSNGRMYACTVDARWVPAEPWIDPKTNVFVQESDPRPVDVLLAEADWESVVKPYPSISIDIGWAQSLNVVYDTSENLTGVEALGSACATTLEIRVNADFSAFGDPMAQCLDSALAIYLTDGLARIQTSVPTFFSATGQTSGGGKVMEIEHLDLDPGLGNQAQSLDPKDFRDTSRFTELYFPAWRYGYGYGFKGITIYIATTVLLLYAVLAVIHMGIVMTSGISSSTWGTVGEMLVLAINSSNSAQLQNTCAGVRSSTTWGLVANIRETADQHLELVLAGDERSGGRVCMPPKQDKAYGNVPSIEAAGRVRRRVASNAD